jgi:hypothetical protein
MVRGLLANRLVLAGLVLLAAGAEFGLAWVSHPVTSSSGTGRPAATAAVVSSLTRACPAPGSAGAAAGGIAVASTPRSAISAPPAGHTVAGTAAAASVAVVTRLSPAGSAAPGPAIARLTRAGVLTLGRVRAGRVPKRKAGSGRRAPASTVVPAQPAAGGVVVQATGSMAQGLEAEQTGPRHVPTAECGAPGTDFWFVGPGEHSAGHIQVYLMNPGVAAAAVSVTVYTDSGPLLGSTDTGIAVPPHGMVLQSLDRLLRRSRVIALHVSTSLGQVVAAVRETRSLGSPGAWLPAAQPPATSQVLPGLPAAPGSRELYVAVPGATNAQIKVTAVTGKGSYQPTGGSGIDLPGGSAVGIALPSLGGIPAAIRITSNVPITAAMMLPGGPGGAPGVFTVAAAPVQQQGIIAVNLSHPAGASDLILSAPGPAAQVSITDVAASGETGPPQTVPVRSGHTAVVRLHAPGGAGAAGRAGRAVRAGLRGKGGPFAVVVRVLAGSGPVYAGRVLTIGSVTESVLPVTSALSWVPLPRVSSSLQAALP